MITRRTFLKFSARFPSVQAGLASELALPPSRRFACRFPRNPASRFESHPRGRRLVGNAGGLLTACQQPMHRFSFASQRLARHAMVADVAHRFFGDDVYEPQKNVSRQVTLAEPPSKVRLRDAEVKPKLFITANNFRRAA